jgi:hypothetical protein
MDVPKHVQRRPNAADGREEVRTSLMPVAATCNVKDAVGRAMADYQVSLGRNSGKDASAIGLTRCSETLEIRWRERRAPYLNPVDFDTLIQQ